MPIRRPKPIYRPVLAEAARRVFAHRDVWLFGLFTGLVLSGGVLETFIRTQARLRAGSGPVVNLLFPQWETVRQWADQLVVQDSLRVLVTLLFAIGVIVVILAFSSVGQGALFAASVPSMKKRWPRFHELMARGKHHALHLLGITLVTKLILVFWGVVTLTPTYTQGPFTGFLDVSTLCVAFLGMILTMSIAMFMMASIVMDDASCSIAFQRAWHITVNNTLTVLEIALLLFLINLAVSAAVTFVLYLLLFPYTLFFLYAANTEAITTSLATGVSFSVMGALFVLTLASLTAFNYLVYGLAYKKLSRGKVLGKISRWLSL